jgi:DNA (cytosine-5)-methyltransferase 1
VKAVSLFSGCGGADLGLRGKFHFNGKGYSSNGVEIVHASDIDSKSVLTYNQNFEIPALIADVKNLHFGLHSADIVIGGFPCQSFSSVNPTKNPFDSRGQLYNEFVRVVQEIEPRFFVGENVRGFFSLKGGFFFKDFEAKMKKTGYRVCHAILRAADYGVPQLRDRLFVVGVRNDLPREFIFPHPLFGDGSRDRIPYVPIASFLDDHAEVGEKYYFSQRAVDGVKRAKKNMKRALAQDPNGPSLTLTSHLAKVSLNSRDPVLLVDARRERYRRFTPREAARLQSFPESFSFAGSESDAYRQIGNAIPPVVMWHIARAAKRILRP